MPIMDAKHRPSRTRQWWRSRTNETEIRIGKWTFIKDGRDWVLSRPHNGRGHYLDDEMPKLMDDLFGALGRVLAVGGERTTIAEQDPKWWAQLEAFTVVRTSDDRFYAIKETAATRAICHWAITERRGTEVHCWTEPNESMPLVLSEALARSGHTSCYGCGVVIKSQGRECADCAEMFCDSCMGLMRTCLTCHKDTTTLAEQAKAAACPPTLLRGARIPTKMIDF